LLGIRFYLLLGRDIVYPVKALGLENVLVNIPVVIKLSLLLLIFNVIALLLELGLVTFSSLN